MSDLAPKLNQATDKLQKMGLVGLVFADPARSKIKLNFTP